MRSAGFGSPGHPGRVDQPWGHHVTGNEIRPTREDKAPAYGLGTVRCTVPNWAKFASPLHLQGAAGKGGAVETGHVSVLHTPPPGTDYAGGWFVRERAWAGGRTLSYDGTNTNWYAAIWIAPVHNFAVLTGDQPGGLGRSDGDRSGGQQADGFVGRFGPARDGKALRAFAETVHGSVHLESRSNLPLSKSTSPQAGSPLTGFDGRPGRPGNCTE